jgi:SAM-dependent methyltransferase
MSGFIGGEIGYRILKSIGDPSTGDVATAYEDKSKVDKLLGPGFWSKIQDKVVIDFGCGFGEDAVEMAEKGARKVVGLDIREEVLEVATRNAHKSPAREKCEFVQSTAERADVITSIDAFEHFEDPAEILQVMRGLLKDDGRVIAVFGPTWYHPLGGHLFSVFPFAHLIFTENALIRWRSDFKTDGATRFSEVAGGLNSMTISRFKKIVSQSPFKFEKLELVPIRTLKWLANSFTKEITTSVVRCELVPRDR